ncbi:MAG: VWA domain-containing protein [Terracidiphilus sp.]
MIDARRCTTDLKHVELRKRFGAKTFSLTPLAFLSVTILLAATSTAQTDQTPFIRTTTRLVQLDVVVVDKQNYPVAGLTKDDFRVFDNGAPQEISHFLADAGTNAVPAEPSPYAVSNRPSSTGAPGVTVILVDEMILGVKHDWNNGLLFEMAHIKKARLEVLKYLTTLQPGELVALYALRPEGVVVIHDFTDDPKALIAAAQTLGTGGHGSANIAGLRPGEIGTLREWSANASPGPRSTPETKSRNETMSEDVSQSVIRGGFQGIIQHLAGVPGRKNLVWISSTLPGSYYGFGLQPFSEAPDSALPRTIDQIETGHSGKLATETYPDPRNSYNELSGFARMLSNANISVYLFDAHELVGTDSPPGSPLVMYRPSDAQWGGADIIASETGGRAIFNSNALDQHLREIVAESNASYQIGYYPGDKAWDGKYHRIELKLAPEHKGLTLLCRKGYYAVDNLSPSYETFREAERSPVESPGIGLTLNVPSNPIEWGPEKVVLKLNVREIRFEQKGDMADANLAVAFVQLGNDGRILEGFTDNVALALPPDDYAAAKQEGWFYSRQIIVSGYAEKLRVVVRDRATGATGSVSVHVEEKSNQKTK